MTTKHAGYIVTLENDLREDDAEATLTALSQIKGVVAVEPVEADVRTALATARVRRELCEKLFEVLYPGAHDAR